MRTTGIFCRPICPAPTPLAAHCSFWPSAAAARAAGFKPCLRCRPEAAPSSPAWRRTQASVGRALRLIGQGALDGDGSVERSARLGIEERVICRRLFERHVGATPQAVARLRRVLFAKKLIDETRLPMTESRRRRGFASQRRFNACLSEVYGRPPSALRRRVAARRRSRTRRPGPPSFRSRWRIAALRLGTAARLPVGARDARRRRRSRQGAICA
ncbi:MAG: Ada metal-binding domain-containing protein [Myxococcota bacterium]